MSSLLKIGASFKSVVAYNVKLLVFQNIDRFSLLKLFILKLVFRTGARSSLLEIVISGESVVKDSNILLRFRKDLGPRC